MVLPAAAHKITKGVRQQRRLANSASGETSVTSAEELFGSSVVASQEQATVTTATAVSAVRVMTATRIIQIYVLPFWFVQLLFGFLSLFGIGAEAIGDTVIDFVSFGLVSVDTPALGLFYAGYFFVLLIGICSMFAAAIIYRVVGGVHVMSDKRWLIFGLCLIMYFPPLLINLVPWAAIYVLFMKDAK